MNVSVKDMQNLVAREQALGTRLGHTALLVVAASVSAVIAQLWLTEPSLPLRTHIAFGAIVGIGLSWTAYAAWVLSSRRVMLANQRVIAAWMAVGFTALFLVGAVVLRERVGSGGVITSAVLLAVACVILTSARRRVAQLTERRDSLKQCPDA